MALPEASKHCPKATLLVVEEYNWGPTGATWTLNCADTRAGPLVWPTVTTTAALVPVRLTGTWITTVVADALRTGAGIPAMVTETPAQTLGTEPPVWTQFA